MNWKVKLGIPILLVAAFVACDKENNAPIVPEIESRSFEFAGSSAIWRVGFIDGDGDIGTRQDEDQENFFTTLFYMQDGVFIQNDTLLQDYRVPFVEKKNPNRPLEGEIAIEMDGFDFFLAEGIDTFYIEAYLVDRALHQSNTIATPTVILE